MQYLGGKKRIAKPLASYFEYWKDLPYIEPFCGSAKVASLVASKDVTISDISEPLISLYFAMQNGWVPPSVVSEEEYALAKGLSDSNPLKGFIGFGCAFSGKYFGGYARNDRKRNYARDAHNSLLRQRPLFEKAKIDCVSYTYYADYKNSFFYLDPPYENTTGYKGTKAFDHEVFWSFVRRISRRNIVLTSSYKAPADFLPLLKFETRTDMHGAGEAKGACIEKVFIYEKGEFL